MRVAGLGRQAEVERSEHRRRGEPARPVGTKGERRALIRGRLKPDGLTVSQIAEAVQISRVPGLQGIRRGLARTCDAGRYDSPKARNPYGPRFLDGPS